jgi:hypothetical protein
VQKRHRRHLIPLVWVKMGWKLGNGSMRHCALEITHWGFWEPPGSFVSRRKSSSPTSWTYGLGTVLSFACIISFIRIAPLYSRYFTCLRWYGILQIINGSSLKS